MTDLEARVRTAMLRAADAAPSATGLAYRVHERRRTRRRAVAGGGAALAAAAAVALIAVLPGLGGGDTTTGSDTPPADRPDPGWRTATIPAGPVTGGRDVDVDLPGDWGRLDTTSCEYDVLAYGPPGTDPCDVDYPLAVRGAALYDVADLPGTIRSFEDRWSGYVITDEAALTATSDDRAVTRRVLASARPAGVAGPDVEDWSTERISDLFGAITADVPGDPSVRVRLDRGLPDCDPGRRAATLRRGGQWSASLCRDRIVSVDAPTQALADVVAATVGGW